MNKITYTFGRDCKVAALAGKTFTGGEFCRADGNWQGEPDAVRFVEKVDGKAVMAKIAGKPELEEALAAGKAEKAAVADRLAAIGWPQYKAAQRAAYNARAAYDRASEYGYPAREAAAMRAADDALDGARTQYPLAAAYAKAESYSLANNYAKVGAGTKAMAAIGGGADPLAAVAAMEQEWSAAAAQAVANA